MPRIVPRSIETSIVRNCLELFVYHHPLRMDYRASEYPTAKQTERAMESIETDVLDDCGARAGNCMGH